MGVVGACLAETWYVDYNFHSHGCPNKPGLSMAEVLVWTWSQIFYLSWSTMADLCTDLLILGLGKDMRPLSAPTRRFVNSLGIRIDIQDTRNAAAQFNLLATERGVGTVAAALVPLGWRENVGFRS